MPKFCANLTMLFTERPFLERFGAAKSAGFDAVEVLFPYDVAASQIRSLLDGNALTLALINGPPPNYTDRPRGFAAIGGGEALFEQDFRRALRHAQALGAQHIHLMAGVAQGPAAKATMIANLRYASALAPDQSLTIEPINQVDMPWYFLNDYDLALEILDALGAPNLHLQFDAYHAHRITGDVFGTWDKVRHRTAHVQVAGYPGRGEPMGGDIDYGVFFQLLDQQGYGGWVSGEYNPQRATPDGLDWIR